MDRIFRIGIIGAGHIAEKMASTIGQMDDAEAYAIASRSKDKAEAFASKWGFRKYYGSYEEMAGDPEVDLIYVATPHSLHFSHVKLCLDRGKPVLCEKAFMANAAEAEEAIRLSEEKGVFLAEAIWSRYLPFMHTVKRLIDSGKIGEPKSLSAHLGYPVTHKERIIRADLGGGALLDLGVYTLNFAAMMFGPDIESISSSCIKSDTGVDLQENMTISYRDGKTAFLLSTAESCCDRQGIICGDKGYLTVDNISNPLNAWVYSRNHDLIDSLSAPEQITGFEYQVRACMDAIRKGQLETDFMPHSETVRIMKIMDSLRKEWGVVFPNDSFRSAE